MHISEIIEFKKTGKLSATEMYNDRVELLDLSI